MKRKRLVTVLARLTMLAVLLLGVGSASYARDYISDLQPPYDRPGMRPAYPGLHELHVTIIKAAKQTSGLSGMELREQLKQCRTLSEILAEHDSSGQQAVDTAMQRLDSWLDALVEKDRLSQEQRDSWLRASAKP